MLLPRDSFVVALCHGICSHEIFTVVCVDVSDESKSEVGDDRSRCARRLGCWKGNFVVICNYLCTVQYASGMCPRLRRDPRCVALRRD